MWLEPKAGEEWKGRRSGRVRSGKRMVAWTKLVAVRKLKGCKTMHILWRQTPRNFAARMTVWNVGWLKKQNKEETQGFRSEQLEACSCYQLGGTHPGREGGHLSCVRKAIQVAMLSGQENTNNLEIWKRSKLQGDTRCCWHTATLSNQDGEWGKSTDPGKRGPERNPVVPWPLRP